MTGKMTCACRRLCKSWVGQRMQGCSSSRSQTRNVSIVSCVNDEDGGDSNDCDYYIDGSGEYQLTLFLQGCPRTIRSFTGPFLKGTAPRSTLCTMQHQTRRTHATKRGVGCLCKAQLHFMLGP